MNADAADELVAVVRSAGLVQPGQPAVVMLSGGRDSVCLLDIAVRICGPEAITALHVNYGLRDGAVGDQAHCESVCGELGVKLTVRTPDAPDSSSPTNPRRGNLQAWARDARYGAAAQLALERGAVVAAGHTATDQVETILYRLASSPSRRALLGMRARDGALVRPLLQFTREQTADYCLARELGWRDDETNETDKYARGRVRNGLVPALREIHPGAERNVLALAEILRDEAAVLDVLVADILRGGSTVPMTELRALDPAISRLVVQRLADAVLGQPAPGCGRRLPDILALSDAGTRHLDLPHGVRATVTDGTLSFGATPDLPLRPDNVTGQQASDGASPIN